MNLDFIGEIFIKILRLLKCTPVFSLLKPKISMIKFDAVKNIILNHKILHSVFYSHNKSLNLGKNNSFFKSKTKFR